MGKLSKEDKDYITEQAQRYSCPIHVLRKVVEEKAGGALPRKELQYMLSKAKAMTEMNRLKEVLANLPANPSDEILDAVTIKTTDSVSAKLMSLKKIK
eukprot:g46577.t1